MTTTPKYEVRKYDHKMELGPYGVCRRCGREHDPIKDAEEMKVCAALALPLADKVIDES
jgi:hypothetical protein